MEVHTHTEAGGKIANEDYLISRRHPASDSIYICLLADGQGGRANGALAARTACEAAWNFVVSLSRDQLFDDGTWIRVLEHADRETVQTGGCTTLIALAVDHGRVAGASCGDSKVFFDGAILLKSRSGHSTSARTRRLGATRCLRNLSLTTTPQVAGF